MSKVLSHSSPFNYRQWPANSQSRKEFATDVAACDAYCLESEFKECDTDGVILGQMPGDLEVSIEDLCQVAGDKSRG